jgi:hypothetical protein
MIVKRERAAAPAREVEARHVDVTIACETSGSGAISRRAHQQLPAGRIDHSPFILEPAPRAIVRDLLDRVRARREGQRESQSEDDPAAFYERLARRSTLRLSTLTLCRARSMPSTIAHRLPMSSLSLPRASDASTVP